MALLLLLPYTFLFLALSLSPSHSLNCTSQSFKNNKLYKNCSDLPSLNAYLHWTYYSTNTSLSIAFLAPPAKSNGWVAWAINPTATGMVGSQALIAFKQSSGSMTVKTYNISSYGPLGAPSKLSFDMYDLSAEYSGGLMKIFATLVLPKNTTVVNQVWQVGGSVDGDTPQKHATQLANLNAKGPLELVKAESNGTAPPPAPGSSNGTAPRGSINGTPPTGNQSNNKSGESSTREGKVGIYVILLFIGILAL